MVHTEALGHTEKKKLAFFFLFFSKCSLFRNPHTESTYFRWIIFYISYCVVIKEKITPFSAICLVSTSLQEKKLRKFSVCPSYQDFRTALAKKVSPSYQVLKSSLFWNGAYISKTHVMINCSAVEYLKFKANIICKTNFGFSHLSWGNEKKNLRKTQAGDDNQNTVRDIT